VNDPPLLANCATICVQFAALGPALIIISATPIRRVNTTFHIVGGPEELAQIAFS
jgi:hypothetical protein